MEEPAKLEFEFADGMSEGSASVLRGSAPLSEFRYAPLWRRFYAYAADNIFLVSTITLAVGVSMNLPWVSLDKMEEKTLCKLALFMVFFYHFISALYYTLAVALLGTTLGKSVLGVRVAMSDGAPVSIHRAFIRFVGYYPGAMLFYLGFAWALVDPRSQALHDKLAGTVVLEIE
ncbi:MAG: RDD family protein [Nitrospinota bacterium]|nr:RDD family protein [Nitrospinota bacterium]